jgi:hypothetical protein
VATSVSPVTHGFDALIRPSAGHVCHSLMVVSNCTPGSAHAHAANAISSHSLRALSVLTGFATRFSRTAFAFSVRQKSGQSPSSRTARMKALSTRTELFEFWPETVKYAAESQSVLYSAICRPVYPCFANCTARST